MQTTSFLLKSRLTLARPSASTELDAGVGPVPSVSLMFRNPLVLLNSYNVRCFPTPESHLLSLLPSAGARSSQRSYPRTLNQRSCNVIRYDGWRQTAEVRGITGDDCTDTKTEPLSRPVVQNNCIILLLNLLGIIRRVTILPSGNFVVLATGLLAV